MAELKDKIENGLNEARTVFLGVEILLAFDYQGVFQPGFDSLPAVSQAIKVAGLAFLLVATALLLAPAAFHQIAERGEDTERLNNFTTAMVGASLAFFATDLAVNVSIAVDKGSAPFLSAGAGIATFLVAGFFWYGLEAIARRKYHGSQKEKKNMVENEQAPEKGKTPLAARIRQALTETRVVLPGIQALLGFQFAVVVTSGFEKLNSALQTLHLVSLAMIAISTVLLMSPTAYHRIVDEGEDTERVHRFTGRMILAAMFFLALGISGDFYVVVAKVFRSSGLALAGSLGLLVLFLGLWFGWMLLLRAKSPLIQEHAIPAERLEKRKERQV